MTNAPRSFRIGVPILRLAATDPTRRTRRFVRRGRGGNPDHTGRAARRRGPRNQRTGGGENPPGYAPIDERNRLVPVVHDDPVRQANLAEETALGVGTV